MNGKSFPNNLVRLSTLTLYFGLLVQFPSYSAGLYKWIDEDGTIRYSDTLSAQQKRKKFQTLSGEGRILKTKEAEKTAAQKKQERAEAKRLKKEADLLAKNEEKQRKLKEHHDNVLLMTFTNETEIVSAQNERIDVIDSVINLLRKNMLLEQEKLEQQENQVKQAYTDKGKEVPGGYAQKIEYSINKILSTQQQLDLKIKERDSVNQQYIEDLIRYRELIKLKKEQNL